MSADLWERIIGALGAYGVEIIDGGARWAAGTPANFTPVNDREAS